MIEPNWETAKNICYVSHKDKVGPNCFPSGWEATTLVYDNGWLLVDVESRIEYSNARGIDREEAAKIVSERVMMRNVEQFIKEIENSQN